MRPDLKQIERNAGLDLLRALAIAFVLIYHLPFGDAVGGLGLYGVEIFLTLSGFLVATMFFERFGGVASAANLERFLINRWMRTLPLYVLALGATAVVTVALGLGDVPKLLPFLTFTQNLVDGGQAAYGNWFGASWSLALEEWFYLGVPLVLFLARRHATARMIVVMTLVLMLVAVGGRALRYATAAGFDFDDMYRRAVIFRLDTFCWGMLMYLALQRWRAAVLAWRTALFLAGIALIGLSALAATHPGYGQAVQAIAFLTITSIGTALMLPFFFALALPALAARAAGHFSTRTYALYLTHGLVYAIVARLLPVDAPLAWFVMLVASVTVADVVYRRIERPILALRGRAERGLSLCRTAGDLMARLAPLPVMPQTVPVFVERRRVPR